jgi:Arc/MetJ-type ribon-helix-helix transcriptional regulator
MDEPTKKPRGRPRKGATGKTTPVPLRVDEATLQKLDALVEYGGYGTSRTEIVMYILRLWLRENHEGLKTEIAAKLAPFSGTDEAPSGGN